MCDFFTAEDWFKKALVIFEPLGDDYWAGIVKESLNRLNTKY